MYPQKPLHFVMFLSRPTGPQVLGSAPGAGVGFAGVGGSVEECAYLVLRVHVPQYFALKALK